MGPPAAAPEEAPPRSPSQSSLGPRAEEEGLRVELLSLDRAVKAVDAERFQEALSAARAFRGRYPTSDFLTEAGVVEVLALCGLARVDEARAAEAALPATAAQNPVVRRLENSCARRPTP